MILSMPLPHDSMYPARKKALAMSGLYGFDGCLCFSVCTVQSSGRTPAFQIISLSSYTLICIGVKVEDIVSTVTRCKLTTNLQITFPGKGTLAPSLAYSAGLKSHFHEGSYLRVKHLLTTPLQRYKKKENTIKKSLKKFRHFKKWQ